MSRCPSQGCMGSTMSADVVTLLVFGENSVICSIICQFQLLLMKEYSVCMVVYHLILIIWVKSMKFKNRKTLLIKVYFAICFGLIPTMFKDGQIMKGVSHTYLEKKWWKNFALNMTSIWYAGLIKLLRMVTNSFQLEDWWQYFLHQIIVVSLIIVPPLWT